MDFFLFEKLNNLAEIKLLSYIAFFFAKYFGYLLLVFLIIFFSRKIKIIFLAIISGILSRFIIVDLIRSFYYRPRPFIERSVNLLIEYPDKASFPSGHASFFFAVATFVFLENKKIGSLFLIGAFLISISRVISGIHWPTDIIFGALIGILSGILVDKIFRKIKTS